MGQSNSTSSSNIPYSKLSDNSQKEKQKPESQWKNCTGSSKISYTRLSDDSKKNESAWKNNTSKYSTNTQSFPEQQNCNRFK